MFGQTKHFKRRIKSYKSSLKNRKANRILQNCYNKYGWESLKFEIVQNNIPEDLLLFVEDIWMGANCSRIEDKKGGMNVLTSSTLVNKEYKKKVYSESSTQKNKTGYDALRSKEVHKYDLDGKYIESYGSAREAAKFTNSSNVAICNCIKKIKNGLNASCDNFMWSYEKHEFLTKYINKKGKATAKKIKQFDKNKNFLKEFQTIADACRELNLYDSNIISSAKSNFKLKSGEFYWSY